MYVVALYEHEPYAINVEPPLFGWDFEGNRPGWYCVRDTKHRRQSIFECCVCVCDDDNITELPKKYGTIKTQVCRYMSYVIFRMLRDNNSVIRVAELRLQWTSCYLLLNPYLGIVLYLDAIHLSKIA